LHKAHGAGHPAFSFQGFGYRLDLGDLFFGGIFVGDFNFFVFFLIIWFFVLFFFVIFAAPGVFA